MLNNEWKAIKERFYRLIGSLSVEEIMSNPPLIEKIKTVSGLLLALTSGQKGRA
ncbi:hypothetical protein WDW37_20750 [Bdellovibrionota bacterium FG-1]